MADETTEPQEKKSGRLKPLIMLVVVLAIEAVVIIGAMKMLSPQETEAQDMVEMAGVPDTDRITEMLIVDARLPNAKPGVTYLYDTEVYVQVKQKFADRVTQELEQYQNEIRAELTAIWRTSEPHHFSEPRLENLTRKVHGLMSERFGTDPETDEPIVTKCVIVMGTGFRVDN